MTERIRIQEQLVEFVRREVFSPDISVSEDTDLLASGFDSMSLVNVLLFIEKTYDLWIPGSEITEATFQSIRTLAALVVRLLDERRITS